MYGKGRTIWKVIGGWGAKFFVQAEIEWKNRTRGVVLKNIPHWPKKTRHNFTDGPSLQFNVWPCCLSRIQAAFSKYEAQTLIRSLAWVPRIKIHSFRFLTTNTEIK